MSLTTQRVNYKGNMFESDGEVVAWDAMTNKEISSAARPAVCAGTGAPTFSAPVGSLYLRLDGSSTSTRAYIATNNSGTWTAVTTAG